MKKFREEILKEIKKEPKNSLSDNSYTFIKKKLADLDNNIK
jgi:sRNA-binding carbon storage regulator CsrA